MRKETSYTGLLLRTQIECSGEAEVREYEVVVPGYEDVCRFDVPVKDAMAVKIF